ncbi:MAG: signal peptidase II [Granulosicoccaceae bacterium]|jgi:signal peptidase II
MTKWLGLSLIVIVIDQVTKYIAETQLQFQVPVPVMPSFNWFLAHNTGAAFSFLSEAGGWQRWFFVALALVISAVIIIWMRRLPAGRNREAIALALILGGALGNVIDRLWHGYVIDFIQWYYEAYYWPAFNIADAAITLGAALLILDAALGLKKANRQI